jgi:RecG-like helicase
MIKKFIEEIRADNTSQSPMNRLLRRCGLGKLLWHLGQLDAYFNEHQVAFMAPTEFLATAAFF